MTPGVIADKPPQFVVGLELFAGQLFLGDQPLLLQLCSQFAHESDAVYNRIEILTIVIECPPRNTGSLPAARREDRASAELLRLHGC